MDDETKRRIQAARAAGWSEDNIQRMVLTDQQRTARSQPDPQQQAQQKTLLQKAADAEIMGVKLIPTATGTLGAVGGFAVGGPVGAVAGGLLGASAGEGLRQTLDTKEGYQPLEIAEEGAYGALGEAGGQILGRFGGKLIKPILKRGVKTAAKFAGVAVPEAGEAVAVGGSKVARKIASGYLKETPTQWLKAAEAGIDPNELMLKYVPQLGTTMDELLGPVTRGKAFGHSGSIQAGIKGAEETIQGISTQAGKNIKVMGDDLMQALLIEKKAMGQQLGSKARLNALSGIIEEAQKKYAKGHTVKQALILLREANERFGASILDDTADAVATAAQKLEGNTLRRVLRKMFPVMGDALDTQGELITLREILKGTASKQATGGFKLGRLDLSRPGTLFDALVSSGPAMKATATLSKAAAKDYGKVQFGTKVARAYLEPAFSQVSTRALAEGQGGLTQRDPTDLSTAADPSAVVFPGQEGAGVSDTGMEFAEDPSGVSGAAPSAEGEIPTQEEFKKAYYNAVMAGDTKAAAAIKTASEFLHEEGTGMTLSDTAIASINDLNSGIRGVDNLIGMIGAEGSQTGPIVGKAALIPYATSAKTLQAEIDRVKQKVGKALEGGVLRKEDEEKYKKILPTINDTEEVAMNKLAALKRELTKDLQGYVSLQTGHGKGADQPASAANLRFAEDNPESFYSTPEDVNFSALYP